MSLDGFTHALSVLKEEWEKRENEFNQKYEDLLKEKKELEVEKHQLLEKYRETKEKLDHIENQLEKAMKEYEDLAKNVKADALKMLDLYLVLLEQVFSANPHMRLLLVLHGDKETYTLEELSKATGINQLEVRQAIFAMRNVNVVEYNDETHEVKLLQRLF